LGCSTALRFAAALALVVMAAGCRSPAERAAQPIIEKNAAARGGLEAWRKVQALSLAGNLEAGVPRDPLKQAQAAVRSRAENKAEARRAQLHPAEEGPKQVLLPFLMELKRPRATRMEIVFQGKTAVQVYDGKNGWKVRPFLGRREVEPYTAEELTLAAQQAELDGPLIDYAAKGNKVELVGTEPFEGREAFKLKVTTAAGVVRTVLVDAENYLEVRVDGQRRMDGKLRQVWTALRDYKPVDGLLIPHTLETTVEGVPGSEKILVEKVSVNPEVADARFSKPE
jgi:hypothetical protein